MAKNFDELRLSDDFMFGKVMEDEALCREVLERLLQKPVGELEEVELQREYRYAVEGKPIRLDIYTRDEKAVYDTEMQNLNHRKVEHYDLPKRCRFYQSVMDTDHLEKKQSYRTLPETNILFICTFDPFGEGLPQYTFRNRCDEEPEIILPDETAKYFYNCTYKGEGLPEDIQALYRYIMTGEAVDGLTEKLERAVEAGRRNERWRSEYMKELVLEQDLREEGRKEGISLGITQGISLGILTVLSELGPIPEELKRYINAVTDEEELNRLLRAAVKAKSFEEFKSFDN